MTHTKQKMSSPISSQQQNHLQHQQHHDIINSPVQLSPLEMTINTTSSSPDSPQPELATMTNVNVLDLQKDFIVDAKLYDKDPHQHQQQQPQQQQTVYVYADDKPGDLRLQSDPMTNGSMQMHRIVSSPEVNDQMIGEQHIITDNQSEQLLNRLAISDDHILRLVGPNGESQQIISREIINGEHHILTCNENGEHTITRIVSADHHSLVGSATDDSAIYSTVATDTQSHHKIITTSPDHHHHQQQPQVVYASANDTDQITTSVLQYVDGGNNNTKATQHIYATTTSSSTTTATTVASSTAADTSSDNELGNAKNKHIIYATQGEDVFVEPKREDENFDDKVTGTAAVTGTTATIYAADEDKSPIDLIYGDGTKTVIYTTNGDAKGLELYTGGDLGMIGEGQVIVQGGLQYATQQINGQTVFVVSESLDGDINAQLLR